MDQALPVGDKLPSGIPLTGEEYLAIVRAEAREIPDVMVWENPCPDTLTETCSLLPSACDYFGSQNKHDIHSSLHPSKGWIAARIADFKRLRALISSSKAVTVPKRIADWRKFMYEQHEVPRLPVLKTLTQSKTLKLLEMHIEWIENRKLFGRVMTQWIYGLLLNLDTLLEAGDQSMLRELMKTVRAKRMDYIKDHRVLNQPIFVGLTLVIVIIGTEFGQRDLLD
jgi:hypothetical protein